MFEKVEVSPLSFLQETTENNKDIMIMPIILIVKRLLFIFDKFGMCIVIEKIQFFWKKVQGRVMSDNENR